MKAKGYGVIHHADGTVLAMYFFTGKKALKEARELFVEIVVEDLNDYHNSEEDNQLNIGQDDILYEAKEAAKRMSYTSPSEDVDVLIVKGD
jgi:hypothetical protein